MKVIALAIILLTKKSIHCSQLTLHFQVFPSNTVDHGMMTPGLISWTHIQS